MKQSMKFNSTFSQSQHGMMLIEALIALLIFSVGILGLVGLQTAAVKVSTDSKHRSEAALLANDLIGIMWTSNRANLATDFASPNGALYILWKNGFGQTLPGVAATPPTVTVTPLAGAATLNMFTVTITINWEEPDSQAPNRVIRSYVTQAQIGV